MVDMMGKVGFGLLMGLVIATAHGEEVYKSIGPGGTVSYGDQPDATASKIEEVELAPGPTQDQVEQAEAAGKRLEENVQKLDDERRQRQEAAANRRREARERADALAKNAEIKQEAQQQNTLEEYYGYRDYRFPKLPKPVKVPEGPGRR